MTRRLVFLLTGVLVVTCAQVGVANTMVPLTGYSIMLEDAGNATDGSIWIGTAMLACVLLEGAVYHVWRMVPGPYPYLVSLIANVVSFLVGCLFLLHIPLFISPVITVMVEIPVVKWLAARIERARGEFPPPRVYPAVVTANVVSNIALFAAIAGFYSYHPDAEDYNWDCANNLRAIESAKEYIGDRNRDLQEGHQLSWGDIQPYLKDRRTPKCHGGGVYWINPIGTPPYCSRHGFRTLNVHYGENIKLIRMRLNSAEQVSPGDSATRSE